MKEIVETLKKRAEFLGKKINIIEKRESSYPEGTLRIRKRNNKGVYYHRMYKSDLNGKYIPRNDNYLARQLAQKAYENDYKKCAIKELEAIKKFLQVIDSVNCTNCYSDLNYLRKALIDPIEISDLEYKEKWENIGYTGLKYKEDVLSNFITDAGERVRSKSELMIANMLHRYDVPYRYECPLNIDNSTVYPDFTVLNVRKRKTLYWEHFGMMGDIEYCNNALKKINRYSNNGILIGDKLIATFESVNTPITTKFIQQMIELYLL